MRRCLTLLPLLVPFALRAQLGDRATTFTHADTLRGSIGPGRVWWDVSQYDVTVRPDFTTRSIIGRTVIAFQATAAGQRMQIDLQQPLVVDSITTEVSKFQDSAIVIGDQAIPFEHENNVVWVDLPFPMKPGEASTIAIHYHGTPRAAKHPPWDGGWIWKTDKQGNPWMSVACQGLGASVWYPCKDHQSDEPESATLHITVPDSLQAIGNGRLRSTVKNNDGTTTWNWMVSNPINTYNLVPYIGKYAHWSEVYDGVEGKLDLDYWVLEQNEVKAREQFKQVPPMLTCFEDWFGPYPFYSDGYKLVEAPHLGMEHQSAVAYGNGYQNGYLGMDRSGTGWGLKWDYIIIHESGHEWFGNNITTEDIGDMWIHEGLTCYSETIYTGCQSGTEAGSDYLVGLRKGITNDRPLIGPYGVNQEGSGDMYNKGANLIHTIRAIIGDDARFKKMLREMNSRYQHQTVTSGLIEHFISEHVGRDLETVFDQYLRTTQIPVFEWKIERKRFLYRWADCHLQFLMPVKVTVKGKARVLETSTEWQALDGKVQKRVAVEVDRNWYVGSRKVK